MTAEGSTTRVVAGEGAGARPGERLREAREAAGLTVGEVASRLRLEPRVIERLEQDDYEALHGPTFVRGYLGSYARLLDLPARPILEAYEHHGFGPPALVSELGGKPEVHVSDFPVRLVTYVIAGLLVVLVVLWWQSRQLEDDTPPRAGVVPAPTAATASPEGDASPAGEAPASAMSPTQASSPPADADMPAVAPLPAAGSEPQAPLEAQSAPSPAPETSLVAEAPAPMTDEGLDAATGTRSDTGTEVVPAPTAGPSPAGEAVAAADTVVAALDSEAPLDAGADDAGTAAGAGAQGSDEASGSAGESVSDSAEEPPAAPRPDPLPGSDVLAIQLSRESWIEIYDRGGGRLYYSLAEGGSEVVVTGAGPMRVLLGEAEGAEVAYNGEPFDLSHFQGRSVVRFTVGESAQQPTPRTADPPQAAEEPLTGQSETPAAPAEAPEQAAAVADAAGTLGPPSAEPSEPDAAEALEPVSDALRAPALEPAESTGAEADPEPLPRATRPDS